MESSVQVTIKYTNRTKRHLPGLLNVINVIGYVVLEDRLSRDNETYTATLVDAPYSTLLAAPKRAALRCAVSSLMGSQFELD